MFNYVFTIAGISIGISSFTEFVLEKFSLFSSLDAEEVELHIDVNILDRRSFELIKNKNSNSEIIWEDFCGGCLSYNLFSHDAQVYCFAENSSAEFLSLFVRKVFGLYLLHSRKGVALHACAFVYNNGAYVFVGSSGAGKSTMARRALDEGFLILSDEVVVLRDIGVDRFVYSTPFLGEGICSGNIFSPLKFLCVLEQGQTLEWSILKKNYAIVNLHKTQVINFSSYSFSSFSFSCRFLNRINQFFLLRISLDFSFKEFVEDLNRNRQLFKISKEERFL